MGIILHLITYACFTVFVLAVLYKIHSYSNMPLHLRWELYPVAHEGHKAHYGGSYFEEIGWWQKKPVPNRVSELGHMLPEMLFLVAVKKHNPKLWLRTFPFHFGMYSLIGFLGLLVAGGLAEQITGIALAPGDGLGAALYYLTMIAGFAGAALGIIGAAGLLQRRLLDEDLKYYTKPSDIFNLCFLMLVFVLMLVSGLMNPSFSGLRAYVGSVMTFRMGVAPSNIVDVAGVVIASLAVAYIPLTHMSHFIVKYFTYHNIRWDDEPNFNNAEMESRIGEVLQYPITWSADHVNPSGQKKSWAEVATEEMEESK